MAYSRHKKTPTCYSTAGVNGFAPSEHFENIFVGVPVYEHSLNYTRFIPKQHKIKP